MTGLNDDMAGIRAEGETIRPKKRGRGGRKAWTVVFVVALVVLVASLAGLGVIAYSYFEGQQEYDDLREHVSLDAVDKDLDLVTVDWDALRQINPDVVAWLYAPNTVINYPVVQGTDNDYYLTRDFDGDQGWLANYGAIFMDYRNDPSWRDQVYFIYGHHMRDGSMFADVAACQDQQRFDECRTIYLLTPSGNVRLRTFALVHCDANDPLVQMTFNSSEDMAEYVQDKINRSVVDPGTIPAADDIHKCFAFATCDNLSQGRYVLYAYIEDATVTELHGSVGLDQQNGETQGFATDIQID